jgi:copper chaperone CopZ
MKIKLFVATIVAFVITAVCFAQKAPLPKSETFKVWGNCGMCKSTIEKAAKEAGATTAVWNKATKMLKVAYAETVTSNAKIQEKIAAAGYDTKDLTAPDAAYNELPECCQYERKAAKKN